MILKIEKCENGFILTHYGEVDGEIETVKELVLDDDDSEKGIIELLTKVAEWSGYNYDKFSNKNLNVSFDGVGHKLLNE